MGLISRLRGRRSWREERARTEAYERAIRAGASQPQAAAAAEEAARRARRRRRVLRAGAVSGG
ncbi:hypothetical protein IU500_30130 [Nocardia terpenica]|uniref:Uncharacterized protein n=1 Tax=Nocardia terpenica TaxID=455432 RepID=A0A164MMC2_9NOCA|nr:hypothetical protein [Nocardia terpenica]KZM73489.1 hypothetical protein AWN90_33220 [Nocardia terpenica]MBF6065689.1 hypothetical protein [Nocardia terpenica]MBF6108273.1 hypothetical protein [Nocardia terpenica]MBF6115804.1 hypothetical protein [Nocardia terpenica]MBF6122934.1 hypothetical protein [Nocardia terpenica]